MPLIVAGPGFDGGAVDTRLAHVADVYATVAEFPGASAPPGLDALPLGGPAQHAEVVCGTPGDVCATTGTVKLRRTDATGESLFDLAVDPTESVDRLGDPARCWTRSQPVDRRVRHPVADRAMRWQHAGACWRSPSA